MTQPPDDAALVAILLARADTDREHGHNARASEYIRAATALEAKDRRIEALEAALVAHNCGTPGCLCYECCRAADDRKKVRNANHLRDGSEKIKNSDLLGRGILDRETIGNAIAYVSALDDARAALEPSDKGVGR